MKQEMVDSLADNKQPQQALHSIPDSIIRPIEKSGQCGTYGRTAFFVDNENNRVIYFKWLKKGEEPTSLWKEHVSLQEIQSDPIGEKMASELPKPVGVFAVPDITPYQELINNKTGNDRDSKLLSDAAVTENTHVYIYTTSSLDYASYVYDKKFPVPEITKAIKTSVHDVALLAAHDLLYSELASLSHRYSFWWLEPLKLMLTEGLIKTTGSLRSWNGEATDFTDMRMSGLADYGDWKNTKQFLPSYTYKVNLAQQKLAYTEVLIRAIGTGLLNYCRHEHSRLHYRDKDCVSELASLMIDLTATAFHTYKTEQSKLTGKTPPLEYPTYRQSIADSWDWTAAALEMVYWLSDPLSHPDDNFVNDLRRSEINPAVYPDYKDYQPEPVSVHNLRDEGLFHEGGNSCGCGKPRTFQGSVDLGEQHQSGMFPLSHLLEGLSRTINFFLLDET